MRDITAKEIQEVNGGCAENCWGDFDAEDMAKAASAGSLFGPAAGLAAAAAYVVAVLWFDLE